MTPFLRKLAKPSIWERTLQERLSEPLHLNALSVLVALFGGFESKVYFDLVIRAHNAFCLLQAAKNAKNCGYSAITAIEFGVANGAGLLNMAAIAREVTKSTGVNIDLVGFDAGNGMPPPWTIATIRIAMEPVIFRCKNTIHLGKNYRQRPVLSLEMCPKLFQPLFRRSGQTAPLDM